LEIQHLYLTNIRLIKEREIIGKRFMSIWLDRIENITCSYGILRRTYGKMVFKGMLNWIWITGLFVLI